MSATSTSEIGDDQSESPVEVSKNSPDGGDGDSASKMSSYRIMQQYLMQAMRDVRLCHNHLSVMILPYKDTLDKCIKPYRVRRVVSPFEFILEYVLDGEQNPYSKWFPEMQSFYGNEENRGRLMVNGDEIIHSGACYVCKHPSDGKWHRVRVHSVNYIRSTGDLFFIDLCKLEETSVANLLKITPNFARFPAPLCRCYLYDIAPKKDTTTCHAGPGPTTPWSEEACSYFQDVALRRDKIYKGIVFTRSDTFVTRGLPDVYQNIGVVLVEHWKSGSAAPKKDCCTVNAQMVDAGFAVPLGIFGCCNHTLDLKDHPPPTFDMTDYEGVHPPEKGLTASALPIAVAGPSKSVIPTKEDKKRLFGDRLDEDADLNNNMESNGFPFISHMFYSPEASNTLLPKLFASKLCQVKISYVQGPGHMVLHLTSNLENLYRMNACIKTEVLKSAGEDIQMNLQHGLLVACKMIDGTNNDMHIWCRGMVKGKVKREQKYKILLVDYKTEVACAAKYIRPLADYFKQIPSFGVRAHLDIPPGNSKGGSPGTWSTAATYTFRNALFSWSKDEPMYFVYQPSKATTVPLEHYNQEVCYNRETHKWIAAPQKSNIILENRLRNMRKQPMLSNLFFSYGVDLYYEVNVPNSKFWHFGSLAERIDKEPENEELHQFSKQEPLSKKKFHQKIFGKDTPTAMEKITITGTRNPPVSIGPTDDDGDGPTDQPGNDN